MTYKMKAHPKTIGALNNATGPCVGFKQGHSAARFCRLFDEIRAFLRSQSPRNQPLMLAQRRHIHRERFTDLMGMIAAA